MPETIQRLIALTLIFRTVGARYLEIELQPESAGYPVENIAYVRFSE